MGSIYKKKEHICPNRTGNKKSVTLPSTTNKPSCYKKPFATNQAANKPKMDNSFELHTGQIKDIQKQCEILSDTIRS